MLLTAGHETSVFKVREKFVSLAHTHFIRRCPAIEQQAADKKPPPVPSFANEEDAEAEMYSVPQVESNLFNQLINRPIREDFLNKYGARSIH